MLTDDERAILAFHTQDALRLATERIRGMAAGELGEMLSSIHQGRVDRAGGPSKCCLANLKAADNKQVALQWFRTEVQGAHPFGRNRVTDILSS